MKLSISGTQNGYISWLASATSLSFQRQSRHLDVTHLVSRTPPFHKPISVAVPVGVVLSGDPAAAVAFMTRWLKRKDSRLKK